MLLIVPISFLILWSAITIPMLPLMVILLVPRALRNFKESVLLAPIGLVAGTVNTGRVNMAFYGGIAHFQQGWEMALERNPGFTPAREGLAGLTR